MKHKYFLEFGNRAGMHTEMQVPTAKLAAKLAANMVLVFTNDADAPSAKLSAWQLKQDKPRISWQSSSHFVAITRIEDMRNKSEIVLPGPASAKLWKLPSLPDDRYTAALEFCGYADKRYVLRFCGEFLQSYENKGDAIAAAIKHHEDMTA